MKIEFLTVMKMMEEVYVKYTIAGIDLTYIN